MKPTIAAPDDSRADSYAELSLQTWEMRPYRHALKNQQELAVLTHMGQ